MIIEFEDNPEKMDIPEAERQRQKELRARYGLSEDPDVKCPNRKPAKMTVGNFKKFLAN